MFDFLIAYFCFCVFATNAATEQCFEAEKMIDHPFYGKPSYIFNGVENTCIVAVFTKLAYNSSMCDKSGKQAVLLTQDNIGALQDQWSKGNTSLINKFDPKFRRYWYVGSDDYNIRPLQCRAILMDQTTFQHVNFTGTDCTVEKRNYLCQYKFNYQCAYELKHNLIHHASGDTQISYDVNWYFPSDYHYAHGKGENLQYPYCNIEWPTVQIFICNLSPTIDYSNCSSNCTNTTGFPPTNFSSSQCHDGKTYVTVVRDVTTCNTDIWCLAWTITSSSNSSHDVSTPTTGSQPTAGQSTEKDKELIFIGVIAGGTALLLILIIAVAVMSIRKCKEKAKRRKSTKKTKESKSIVLKSRLSGSAEKRKQTKSSQKRIGFSQLKEGKQTKLSLSQERTGFSQLKKASAQSKKSVQKPSRESTESQDSSNAISKKAMRLALKSSSKSLSDARKNPERFLKFDSVSGQK